MGKRAAKEAKTATDCGFSLYVLLRQLRDFERTQKHAAAVTAAVGERRQANTADDGPGFLAHVPPKAREEYDAMVATVELSMPDGLLERVYFRIPSVCPKLTKRSRLDLHHSVDRDTPGKRIIEYVSAYDGLYVDMVNQQWLQSFRFWLFRFLLGPEALWRIKSVVRQVQSLAWLTGIL